MNDKHIEPAAAAFVAQDQQNPDNIGLSIELDPDGTTVHMVAALQVGPGPNPAIVKVPVEFSQEDTERLYRLSHRAVAEQIRQNQPDTAIPERLPQVITSYDLPEPLSDPLVAVSNGRKRVLDDREPNGTNATRRRYIPSELVHLSECKKQGRKTYGAKRHKGGDWPDYYDAIAEGLLVVELCTTCKPLGKYTDTINTRLAWSTFSVAPEQMPAHVQGFNPNPHLDNLHRYKNYNDAVIGALTIMTAQRWQAHAAFLRWCVEQQYGPARDVEEIRSAAPFG